MRTPTAERSLWEHFYLELRRKLQEEATGALKAPSQVAALKDASSTLRPPSGHDFSYTWNTLTRARTPLWRALSARRTGRQQTQRKAGRSKSHLCLGELLHQGHYCIVCVRAPCMCALFARPPCKYNNAAINSSIHKWSESIKGVTEVLTGDYKELGVMKTAGSTQLGVTFSWRECEWIRII